MKIFLKRDPSFEKKGKFCNGPFPRTLPSRWLTLRSSTIPWFLLHPSATELLSRNLPLFFKRRARRRERGSVSYLSIAIHRRLFSTLLLHPSSPVLLSLLLLAGFPHQWKELQSRSISHSRYFYSILFLFYISFFFIFFIALSPFFCKISSCNAPDFQNKAKLKFS